MGEWLGNVAMAAGVFIAGWWLLCLLVGSGFRAARSWIADLEPSQRGFVLLAMALAPVAVSGLVTLLVFAPPLGGSFVDHHCHSELCSPHAPAMITGGWFALPFALTVLLGTGVALLMLGHALARAIGLGRTLLAVAGERCHAFDVLETDTPGAWCVGLVRPRVLVSRRLVSLLDDEQLAVVLAHERAHALRRDNLRHLAAGIGNLPMPGGTRRQLLVDLRLASEEACDRWTAQQMGGPQRVANTLLAVREAFGTLTRQAGAGTFSPDATDARIAALTRGSTRVVAAWVLCLAIAVACGLLAAAGATTVHHGLEQLPGIIAR